MVVIIIKKLKRNLNNLKNLKKYDTSDILYPKNLIEIFAYRGY